MTVLSGQHVLSAATCPNCWFRPAAAGWETCLPCFLRPERWRVPCTCTSVCPHGRTGHCEDCPPTTAKEADRD